MKWVAYARGNKYKIDQDWCVQGNPNVLSLNCLPGYLWMILYYWFLLCSAVPVTFAVLEGLAHRSRDILKFYPCSVELSNLSNPSLVPDDITHLYRGKSYTTKCNLNRQRERRWKRVQMFRVDGESKVVHTVIPCLLGSLAIQLESILKSSVTRKPRDQQSCDLIVLTRTQLTGIQTFFRV